MTTVSATALAGLPEVVPGADLAELILAAGADLRDEDVLVIAHKVVSKAEGRLRSLADVEASPRALQLAAELGKNDPRHVQVVLEESREVLRAAHGVLISVTHHGFVCANAGVDASNVPGEDWVVLLPHDPDGAARALRSRLRELSGASPAILITDSFGRAWRHGQTDVAIGCAGLVPLEDYRGSRDYAGRELRATWIAIADELAAAADLARTKDGRQPVVRVQGAARYITRDDGPGAQALLRPAAQDLFR
ncbi:MAG: coenzyme F420-0:L-glutamate ligase [Solirubrobacterales bacterium]|nr:coenzyme F420-0:L-glutamate ligase [Solirubrobacterales bacterium]